MPPADPPPKQNAAARLRRSARNDQEETKAETTSAREIELKRSRGEISCAECRRLKIRCDKTIPCQSCQRRGCASLCPNGSLATGQGTRFVLAATEHLHRRIAKMSERVRQLEDSLAILQAKCSNQPHPLLSEGRTTGALQDANEPIPEEAPSDTQNVIDTFGMLSISDHGGSTFFGPTGGPEYLLINDGDGSYASAGVDNDVSDSSRNSRSPPELEGLVRFSAAFPFTPLDPPQDVMKLIVRYLPAYGRACQLSDLFNQNAGWMFSSVSQEQLTDEMIPFFYREADQSAATVDYSGPHGIALLLFVFAMGALVDPEQESYNNEAGHYYQLAHAAICLESVWEKPSMTTIQALHLASVYSAMAGNALDSNDSSMEVSWGMLSLAAQLSQSMGLHRDSARWELPDKMVYRRRLLFWNLFQADSWQSLTTGRPPNFSRIYIDCKFPQGEDSSEKEHEASDFETWFTRCAFHCVAEVAVKTLTARPPSYATIMELDRQVREFPVWPEAIARAEGLAPPDSESMTPQTSMQIFVMSHSREVLLLYIHRSFFAQAILDDPTNPARSPYANSFLTAYRVSCTILRIIRNQFAQYPSICGRMWPIWTYGFSAAVVFGMVVTRGARSPLAAAAMSELDMACELYQRASHHSRRAAKALTILLRLRDKALGSSASPQRDLTMTVLSQGAQNKVKVEEDQDQLEIFAGRNRVASAKQPSLSPSRPSTQPQHPQLERDASPSQQPLAYTHAPPDPQSSLPPYGLIPNPPQTGWVAQQMPMPAYPSHAPPPETWYRQGEYAQPHPAPDYAWSGQHHSHPAPGLRHDRDMLPPSMGSAEGYRHPHSQLYPGPPGLDAVQAPYVSQTPVAPRGDHASLSARWSSFMEDSGCPDDVHFMA